jgi:hypothetical protein
MSETMTMPQAQRRISSLLRQALRAKLREAVFQFRRAKSPFNQAAIQWEARCFVYKACGSDYLISEAQLHALIRWIKGWK